MHEGKTAAQVEANNYAESYMIDAYWGSGEGANKTAAKKAAAFKMLGRIMT